MPVQVLVNELTALPYYAEVRLRAHRSSGGCSHEINEPVAMARALDRSQLPLGGGPDPLLGWSDVVRARHVDVHGRERRAAGRRKVGVFDPGDVAPRQRDIVHTIDLHVVTLCAQVIDRGARRLIAGYRP